jgi:hypothetical protein
MASIAGKLPATVHAGGCGRQGPDPIRVGLPSETPTLPPKQVFSGHDHLSSTPPVQRGSSKTRYTTPLASHSIPFTQSTAADVTQSPLWNREATCSQKCIDLKLSPEQEI